MRLDTASSLYRGFTNGEGQIWLDNVQCNGTETRLIDCHSTPLGQHNCDHHEDIGVHCLIPGISYPHNVMTLQTVLCVVPCSIEGAIRLEGGTATSGRVEICHNNIWGTVCDDFWNTVDPQVACRQLGLPVLGTIRCTLIILSTIQIIPGAIPLTLGFTNGDNQIWLDGVHCVGTETRLTDCQTRPVEDYSCSHTEDAGVACPMCKHICIQ